MLGICPIRIAVPEIGQNMQNYTAAVKAAGAEPVIISVQRLNTDNAKQREYLDVSEFQPEHFDGLLIPGGTDVDPARYGEENQGSDAPDLNLDELQLSVLDRCVKAGLPVFGICRGHQLINVYFGGTLIQHLPTAERHARALTEPDKVHASRSVVGSWVDEVYGEFFYHNSAHHQAVKVLGKGLVADLFSEDDGVLEAMHHESLPIYGVQWHPERMCCLCAREDTEDGGRILRWFVKRCIERRESGQTPRICAGLANEPQGF